MEIEFKPGQLLLQKSTGIMWKVIAYNKSNNNYLLRTANNVPWNGNAKMYSDTYWHFNFNLKSQRENFQLINYVLAKRLYL